MKSEKVQEIEKVFQGLVNPTIAEHSQKFFQTHQGGYGEGDKFLGIRVPIIRKQVKKYKHISLPEVEHLLKSSFHEERLFALLLLVYQFNKGSEKEKTSIYQLYLNNTKYINNWDLVDSSAAQIIGAYLENKDKQLIYELAKSNHLWSRRISIISTFHFIKNEKFDDTLNISKFLINDKHDLIHKAVGWMLREIGKRNLEMEKSFLKENYQQMPRTMLRYAIEKFSESERQKYLKRHI